jgi:prepilin-type N-terminal cleavage/methylation domain-containing protein
MGSSYRRGMGFTLIELMVTVAIIVILAMLAIPSFQAQRQRAAIRGAGDQVLNFWNEARMEALKRNSMVKVGFVQSSSGAVFCMGAATTTDTEDATPCDCTSATPGSNVCDVARYPEDNSAGNGEWNGSTLTGITLGGGSGLSDIQPALIDPKRLFLVKPGDAGTVTLTSPSIAVSGSRSYKLNMVVDRFGRGYLCQSSTSPNALTDYTNTNRVCSP